MYSVRLEKLSPRGCGQNLPHKVYMARTGRTQIFRALTEDQLLMRIMPLLNSAQWELDSHITAGDSPADFDDMGGYKNG